MTISKEKTKENLSFEESLAKLEEIVHQLEQGDLDLHQSLEEYEKGIHLLTTCRDILDGAKRQIYLLRGLDEDGNPKLVETQEESFQSDETVPSRQRGENNTQTRQRKKTSLSDDPKQTSLPEQTELPGDDLLGTLF